MSGPGCSPNSRNNRAATTSSCSYDQENTARTSTPTSPPANARNPPRASRNSAANTANANPGCIAARAATTLSASGNPAHRVVISNTGPGSAATRLAPSRYTSNSRASATDNRSTVTDRAPSTAIRLVSRLRLVTTTTHPSEPGSNGRTCAASRALSNTTNTRRPATMLRYKLTCASTASGIRSAGTANASRNPRTASAGLTGDPAGSNPRRFTYNCPSGNRSATRCAQHNANAVLPTPAVPPIAEITTVPPGGGRSNSTINDANSSTRPAKPATAAGNCRGTRPALDRRKATTLASSGSASAIRFTKKARSTSVYRRR